MAHFPQVQQEVIVEHLPSAPRRQTRQTRSAVYAEPETTDLIVVSESRMPEEGVIHAGIRSRSRGSRGGRGGRGGRTNRGGQGGRSSRGSRNKSTAEAE